MAKIYIVTYLILLRMTLVISRCSSVCLSVHPSFQGWGAVSQPLALLFASVTLLNRGHKKTVSENDLQLGVHPPSAFEASKEPRWSGIEPWQRFLHLLSISSFQVEKTDFLVMAAAPWAEAGGGRINGPAADLLKSMRIIIWQKNTSSHFTQAFANCRPPESEWQIAAFAFGSVSRQNFSPSFEAINHERLFLYIDSNNC